MVDVSKHPLQSNIPKQRTRSPILSISFIKIYFVMSLTLMTLFLALLFRVNFRKNIAIFVAGSGLVLLSFQQKGINRKLRRENAEKQRQVNDFAGKLESCEDSVYQLREDKVKNDQALEELVAENKNIFEKRLGKYRKQYEEEKKSLQMHNKLLEVKIKNQETEPLWEFIRSCKFLNPHNYLEIFAHVFANSFNIQKSAYNSAGKLKNFQDTEKLFDLLWKLATKFQEAKLEGKSDKDAAEIFDKSYASNESETTRNNPKARRERTFSYKGKKVKVWQHLKIGIKESTNTTLRIHFIWDSECRKVIIFHCGKHLYTPP